MGYRDLALLRSVNMRGTYLSGAFAFFELKRGDYLISFINQNARSGIFRNGRFWF